MNKIVGNSQLIQKMNRLKVLNFIRKNPNAVRPQIAHETGLSIASLTNITSYLLDANLITEVGMEKVERVGRKSTLLRFNNDAFGLIYIAVNTETINVSYMNLGGDVLFTKTIDAREIKPEKLVELIREDIADIIDKQGRSKILAIGFSVSGMVLDNRRFVASSSLKWKEFDFKTVLEEETGIPVFINDITRLKAAWHFCLNNPINRKNMLFVDMENGIGVCQFYRGEINRALLGEFGHITVERDGEPCFCGNRGCLEMMCSIDRIKKLYAENGGSKDATLSEIADAYDQGSPAAKTAIDDCGRYLGIGLVTLINLCKPDIIAFNIWKYAEIPQIFIVALEEMRNRCNPVLLQDLDIHEVTTSKENLAKGVAFSLCDRLFDIENENCIVE